MQIQSSSMNGLCMKLPLDLLERTAVLREEQGIHIIQADSLVSLGSFPT